MCKYIEALYKKGCYLDGWGEYFDKNVWKDTAIECGLSLEELAKKEYGIDENLPWDFIDVGLNKDWLKDEYKKAFSQSNEFNLQPTCEHKCINCGVCANLKTKKVLAKHYESKLKFTPSPKIDPSVCTADNNRIIYRYRLRITKKGILKYFSHLDWQNTFLKSLSRTNLPIAFSMGYNPTMKVSMGVALPLFIESDGELIDIELLKRISAEEIKSELTKVLHEDAKVIEVKQIDRKAASIDQSVYWAEYKVDFDEENKLYKIDDIKYNMDKVISLDEILLTKKNKKGLGKTINIKNSIKSYKFEDDSLFIVLRTGQQDDLPTVRIDDFLKLVNIDDSVDVTRSRFFDKEFREL